MQTKYLLTLAFTFLLSNVSMAAPISRAQAQATAQAFAWQKGWIATGGMKNAPVHRVTTNSTATPRSSEQEHQPYYIFNVDGGQGFVIIAGDDNTTPILGYCEQTSFDTDNIPDNMRGWLENIEEEMESLNNVANHHANTPFAVANTALNTPPSATPYSSVAPLLTSGWDQGIPYNALTPNHYVTGCLATAMAQVMRYHQWPAQTVKEIPAYTTKTEKIQLKKLPITTFDWDDMYDTYSGEDNGDAVAKLMLYAGQSLKMDYTAQSSGAQDKDFPTALRKYFGYSEQTTLAYRLDYSIAAWNELLQHELSEDRPIIYCGSSSGGRHCFVCDGFNDEGLYHINWGWGNRYDGWFRISVLSPGTTDMAGASSTLDGYAAAQTAIVNMRPPLDDDTPALENMTLGNLTIVDDMLSFVMKNVSQTLDMGFASILPGSDDLEVMVWETVEPVKLSKSATCRVAVSEILAQSDATQLFMAPVYRISGEGDFMRLHATQYYIELRRTDSGYDYIIHPVPLLSATDIHFNEQTSNRLDFTLYNEGDEYNGQLYLFASQSETKGSYKAFTTVAAANGESQQLSFWFTPVSLEKLTVYIATDKNGEQVIGQRTFGVATGLCPAERDDADINQHVYDLMGRRVSLRSTPYYILLLSDKNVS